MVFGSHMYLFLLFDQTERQCCSPPCCSHPYLGLDLSSELPRALHTITWGRAMADLGQISKGGEGERLMARTPLTAAGEPEPPAGLRPQRHSGHLG